MADETNAADRTVEDDLVDIVRRAVLDETLPHRIVGIGVVVLYADGGVGNVVDVAPEHRRDLANGAALLERRILQPPDQG